MNIIFLLICFASVFLLAGFLVKALYTYIENDITLSSGDCAVFAHNYFGPNETTFDAQERDQSHRLAAMRGMHNFRYDVYN